MDHPTRWKNSASIISVLYNSVFDQEIQAILRRLKNLRLGERGLDLPNLVGLLHDHLRIARVKTGE